MNTLLACVGIVYDAMQAAEQKNCRETGIVDRPRTCVHASSKQIAEMIDDDVIDHPLAGRSTGTVKEDIVQPN